MRLVISKNVGAWSACYVKDRIKDHKKDSNFVLGLPTGGTAFALYKNLISMYNNKEVTFKKVSTFNMDEYIGIPKNHPQSYWSYMYDNFFNHVDIDPKNIHIPDGNAVDIKKECADYEENIAKVGGIQLFLGGVGENGHIAFNEPFSSLSSKTRDKELKKNTRSANSRFFDGDINKVPKSAITVGIDTLLQSEEVLIMITGVKKARALQQILEGPVSHMCPASILQMHKKALVVVDEEACGELKVSTYRFFKTLQDEYSYIEESL